MGRKANEEEQRGYRSEVGNGCEGRREPHGREGLGVGWGWGLEEHKGHKEEQAGTKCSGSVRDTPTFAPGLGNKKNCGGCGLGQEGGNRSSREGEPHTHLSLSGDVRKRQGRFLWPPEPAEHEPHRWQEKTTLQNPELLRSD